MAASYSPTEILPNAFPGIGKAEVDELIASSHIADYPLGTVLCRENMQENIS